jgi:hypothetical protein
LPLRETLAESVALEELVLVEVEVDVVIEVVHVTFRAAPFEAWAVPAVKQASATSGTRAAKSRARNVSRFMSFLPGVGQQVPYAEGP